MLPKKNRLSKNEFSKFFKTGKRFHSPTSTLIYTPNENLHGAVVVSKKIYKQAVKRNKLRRRVYAQIYNLLKKQNKKGVYILILKPSFKNLLSNQQKSTIFNLIEQVG